MKRALVLLAACGSSPAGPPIPGQVAVVVTSPAPGAELSDATITVTGTVTTTNPDYGALEAFVNGAPVTLDDSGGFSTDLTPAPGIDHISVDASDGFGTVVNQQLDVMWAPSYLPTVPGAAAFELDDALVLDLGQQFFDGIQLGTNLDRTTDPIVAHDLASALELILWNIDLANLIGGGLNVSTGSSSLSISIPAVTPAEIISDVRIVDGALQLDIDLNGVFLATNGTFHLINRDLVVAGGITADMHASARLDLAVGSDGSIVVTANDVTATVGPLVPSFTGPDGNELDGFIIVGNNDFRTLVEKLISSQLIPTFTNELPPLLEQLLGATGAILDNVSFTLDAQLGTPVTVTLAGNVDALDIAPGPAVGATPGHVAVHQHASIATGSTPLHADSRGAAHLGSDLPPTNDASLHVLLAQDFLNTLLHALWNAGLLEGSATEGGINVTVSDKLQPVVRPTPDDFACDIDGVRCDVVVELGQLQLDVPDFAQTFAIHATAGARVVVDGTTISLAIQQTPTVTVWDISATPGGRLTPDAIHDIVVNVVWPQLFGALGDKLHITLPLPDLAALGLDQLGPGLANAQLQLAVHPSTSVTEGFLGLGADLELATPHP